MSSAALTSPPAFPSGTDTFPAIGPDDVSRMTGKQKVALLLYSLGTDVSVEVLKHMNRRQAKKLSEEIANTRLPSERGLLSLLQDFKQGFQKNMNKIQEAKRKEEAERARNMPFRSLRQLDSEDIASILSQEQPQTVALVLSYLDPDKAADVLSSFSREMQSDLVERIATIQEIPNELVRRIESIINEKANAFISAESAPATADRRMQTIATILQRSNVVSDDLLDRIQENNPSMAKELRLKAFSFEDILEVDDHTLQRALLQINPGTIALALKIASESLSDKVLNAVDPQLAEDIKDRKDLMGPKTLMEIEEAQKEIIEVIKQTMG